MKAVCPACSKGPKEEITAALVETERQILRLKAQARAFKGRLRSIERRSVKETVDAVKVELALPAPVQEAPNAPAA